MFVTHVLVLLRSLFEPFVTAQNRAAVRLLTCVDSDVVLKGAGGLGLPATVWTLESCAHLVAGSKVRCHFLILNPWERVS